MQDQPDSLAILKLIVAHLRDKLVPELQGRMAFEMRVVVSALELIIRELTLKPTSDSAEISRLESLLGQQGDLYTLNQKLCDAIASGAVGLDTPGLIDHLRATAMEKLAVDQPKYSSYQRALQQH